MPNLSNKVSLITGAGSGIGASTAAHFALCGSYLALNDLNLTGLEKTRQECLAAGLKIDQVLIVQGDLTEENVPEMVIQKSVSHFGQLDVLVNCAGIYRDSNLSDVRLIRDLDTLLAINVKSAYKLTQLAAPYLKLTKGNVVNVSSVVSSRYVTNMGSYSISKAAVDQMTKVLCGELGSDQIRVNSVNPGLTDTGIFLNAGLSEDKNNAIFENFGPAHALQRFARPDEIAKPVAFLASDEASFISGVNLLVDGGSLVFLGPH